MSQVQKLFFELSNERNLKEQFLRERNDLKSKVEEMQKALEWYADEENYDLQTDEYHIATKLDRGDRARAALKGESQ